ncbi:GH36-type glycosyl hydrolase domain-containing protein [Poriferisphaera sp. WC338]|uniref:GH36-type glycosyl hydrolase domain-containing protein n=1 Tax=Poriferisphaera sp. WC338 TaxID=3425129 RepID=UPI003D816018
MSQDMILNQAVETFTCCDETGFNLQTLSNNAGMKISALPNGHVYAIEHESIMVNQQLAHPIFGGITSIFIRQHTNDKIQYYQILGPQHHCHFSCDDRTFYWHGDWNNLRYEIIFELHKTETAWRWQVKIHGSYDKDIRYDAILIQDIGLATRDTIRSNEAYLSQYIDHYIHDHPNNGRMITARQNRSQSGKYPSVTHAIDGKCAAVMSDAYDFYGTSYRITNTPESIKKTVLPTIKNQYEFASAILQSEPTTMSNHGMWSCTFHAFVQPDQPKPTSSIQATMMLEHMKRWPTKHTDITPIFNAVLPGPIKIQRIHGTKPTASDLKKYFPEPWRHEEYSGENLWSFFCNDHEHVVIADKEASVMRSHGHILRSASELLPSKHDICCTSWIGGIFASHVAIGNTSFNKFSGAIRNSLDLAYINGLRIAIVVDDQIRILGTPSIYSMTHEGCRWIYALPERTLDITIQAKNNTQGFRFNIRSTTGEPCELLIFGDVLMGANEYDQSATIAIDHEEKTIQFSHQTQTPFHETSPATRIQLSFKDTSSIQALGGDELLTNKCDRQNYPVFAIKAYLQESISFDLQDLANIKNESSVKTSLKAMLNPIHLSNQTNETVAILDDCLQWYKHNAMVHLSSPHGLEQFGGAAWGVRDVLQGPVEFLLALGHDKEAREIICQVYAEQDYESGQWPQWFMFKPYETVRQADCHGDIIVWPLKSIAHYIQRTGDTSILTESVPFYRQNNSSITILDHIARCIEIITNSCITGTALIRYGDGDWNDSLQPADERFRENMVSTWTVELLYQALGELHASLEHANITLHWVDSIPTLRKKIKADFNKHLIRDDCVAGFALFNDQSHQPDLLLHPSDERTGIAYRLLPMIRGILSEMFTPKQAETHAAYIRKNLLAPDGARLMSKPPTYRGGSEVIFQRAESAASFGREIGLQYVHAHLRYAESLSERGMASELIHALLQACSIQLNKSVPNSAPRQANAYFSSSDAAFSNREEASQYYDRVMTGDVPVRGGWRIYSSGPGIYIRLVIENLLGISRHFGNLVIDPILNQDFDNTSCRINLFNKLLNITYKASTDNSIHVTIDGKSTPHQNQHPKPYRQAGIVIDKTIINDLSNQEVHEMIIHYPVK